MNELTKYLVEQILLEEPTPINKTIVVYVGRFQPFHKGHYATYSHLVKKFGKDSVYIGTSNKVEKPKSPFNFKEKKTIMTTMFGVPSNKIFEVKNPYAPTEILKKFDEKSTAFVTVVGEKDASRLGGKYFQKWNDNPTEGYKDRGYVYVSPMQANSVSGTEVRVGLGTGTEEQKKNFFLDRAYPKFNKTIFNLITNKLQESCIRLSKTELEDILIEVSSGIGQDMVDDGPVIFLPDYNSFKVINGERAKQIGWEIINMVMDDSMDDYITYPEGPTGRVTFFPRGAIGKKDPIGEFDVMVNGAYDKWFKHATRTASLVGYSVVDKALKNDDNLATQLAKGTKKDAEESDKTIQRESITLPVEIGDTLLMGKFKNKKVVVKTIGKDEYGMPTINGKKVVTFRILKEGKQVIFESKEDEKYTHVSFGNYKLKGQEKNADSPTFRKGEDGSYYEVGTDGKKKEQPKQGTSLEPKTPAGKQYQKQLPDEDPAKQQPKKEPKSKVTTFKGTKSGKEIQTTKLEGGGEVFGTQHGNKKMVDDILDHVKSTIPQDKWKDIVFVGEGGFADENNKFEFTGEMKYAQKQFEKIGAGVDTWDGDETNVFDNESPLYKYQEEQTGLSNEEVMAANWASMIGQGDSIEDMSPEDYLTDKGKELLRNSAKEANLPLSDKWDSNPSDEDIDTLYRLSFAEDNNDVKTKVNDAQESFNKFRDVNLLRKTKELSSNGKIPIVLAGESHVELVNNMMQNEWLGSNPVMMEALTQAQRAARRWAFQKNKKLINIKKQRTQIRKKPYSVLYKRAYKLAYLYVRKEWTQRLFGLKKYDELSLPQKQRVSQMVQKKKRKVLKLAKFRFLPALKQKEADRFKGVHQYPSNLTFNTPTNEMSMSQLKGVEKYAEKQLSPQDIEFTKHFFDRVNDPRNGKPISDAELTGFFKRLSRIKNKFKEFLEKYKEIVVRDKRYDINIPFVKQANQAIAKTVMRKDDFKSSDPILSFESEDTIDEANYGFYDGVRGSMTANDAAGATGYMYNHSWEEYDTQEYYLANLPGFSLVHEIPSEFELERAVDQGLPLNVHGDGGKTTKYNRILKADFKSPDEVIKKTIKKESKIPGGLSQGMTLSDIAKKHNVSIEELTNEFKKGYKVEREHTTDIEIAKEIAMDHLVEDPKYYTKLKKIEETIQKVGNKWVVYPKMGGERLGTHDTYEDALKQLRAIELQKFEKINNKIDELAPHGYPDQEWMDNHEKKMKKLRKQLDKQQKVNEVAARYIEPKRVEAFFKKYPKVENLMQSIVNKVKDVDRGYQIFLHYKDDKRQEQYFGGKKDTKSKSTNVKGLGRTALNKTGKSFSSKTSYKYEWDGKMDYPTWGELFQYVWNKKYEGNK